MGLAERITQAQARARVELQKKLEVTNTAERLRQATEGAKLREKALADQEKNIAFVAVLTSLLDVVGAREHLEEVRKVWGCGEIDDAPKLLLDQTREVLPSSMGIALKYRFFDTSDWHLGGGEDTIPNNPDGTDLYKAEVALIVATQIISGLPSVLTSWRYRHLEGTRYTHNFYRKGKRDFDAEPISSFYYYCNWGLINPDGRLGHQTIGPDQIFPENSDFSKDILEKQLIRMCTERSNPLELESDARLRIASNDYLPKSIRNRAFSLKLVSHPFPWYKRLFS